jgi:hypothetical protein
MATAAPIRRQVLASFGVAIGAGLVLPQGDAGEKKTADQGAQHGADLAWQWPAYARMLPFLS